LNEACSRDKQTIADLHVQIDDMVEEVHSLSASKSLFREMSGILHTLPSSSILISLSRHLSSSLLSLFISTLSLHLYSLFISSSLHLFVSLHISSYLLSSSLFISLHIFSLHLFISLHLFTSSPLPFSLHLSLVDSPHNILPALLLPLPSLLNLNLFFIFYLRLVVIGGSRDKHRYFETGRGGICTREGYVEKRKGEATGLF
jgi:hypothetical protein